MKDEILSVNEAARRLAQEQARKFAEQRITSRIIHDRGTPTVSAAEALAEEQAYSEIKKQLIDCIDAGYLVPVHPIAGTASIDSAALIECGMDLFVSIRFSEIESALAKHGHAQFLAHQQRRNNERNAQTVPPPEQEQPTTAATVEQQPQQSEQADTGHWTTSARLIADECFDRDTLNNCRDSLKGYSSRVMDEMQKCKIYGPRGLINNPATIQRDALQGTKWWAKKRK